MRYSFRTSGKSTNPTFARLLVSLVVCSSVVNCLRSADVIATTTTSASVPLPSNGTTVSPQHQSPPTTTQTVVVVTRSPTPITNQTDQDVSATGTVIIPSSNATTTSSPLVVTTTTTTSNSSTASSSTQSTITASPTSTILVVENLPGSVPTTKPIPSNSSTSISQSIDTSQPIPSTTTTTTTTTTVGPFSFGSLAQNASKYVLNFVQGTAQQSNANSTASPTGSGPFGSFQSIGAGYTNYTKYVAKFLTKNVTTAPESQFSDFMPDYIRNHGGVVLHFFLLVYVCLSLGIICDLYFLTSIEYIGNTLKLPADIAGATFMALGTSAPELFIALIGVFIAEDDIGTSTILGSAVFNLIFVPSICAYAIYFSGMVYPKINKYSILRDAIFYLVAITTLLLALKDNEIDWIESMCMLGLYCVYVLILYINAQLGEIVEFDDDDDSESSSDNTSESNDSVESEITPLLQNQGLGGHLLMSRSDKYSYTNSYSNFTKSMDWAETGRLRPVGSLRTPMSRRNSIRTSSIRNGSTLQLANLSNSYQPIDNDAAKCRKGGAKQPLLPKPPTDEEPSGMPENWAESHWWLKLFMLPTILLVKLTVPKPNKYNYFLTFFISILWISGFTYLSVWLVTIIGNTLGLPSSVLGLTILAAGASIPEVISSVIVVKRAGLANMALCNLFGSNIFDILICLGLPWLIKSIIQMVRAGSTEVLVSVVTVQSHGLLFTTFVLLCCVVSFIGTLAYAKWRFGLFVGVCCSVIYFTAISIATVSEIVFN